MRFIYGIKVHDELQTDEMKRPRRFEHFDDAAKAAAVVPDARVVCLDWCTGPTTVPARNEPAAAPDVKPAAAVGALKARRTTRRIPRPTR